MLAGPLRFPVDHIKSLDSRKLLDITSLVKMKNTISKIPTATNNYMYTIHITNSHWHNIQLQYGIYIILHIFTFTIYTCHMYAVKNTHPSAIHVWPKESDQNQPSKQPASLFFHSQRGIQTHQKIWRIWRTTFHPVPAVNRGHQKGKDRQAPQLIGTARASSTLWTSWSMTLRHPRGRDCVSVLFLELWNRHEKNRSFFIDWR